MPRRNRVDPFGDLHAVAARGMFTGNRGCLVDGADALGPAEAQDSGADALGPGEAQDSAAEQVVRHHRGNLWITCVTVFRDRRVGLARPGRWTPLFFLDDAVALAAGHRPCGECRYAAYRSYRDAVGPEMRAGDLNRRLATERLRPGRGVARAVDRRLWNSASVPDGTMVLHDGPRLVLGDRLLAFSFDGWHDPVPRPTGDLTVLTPPTSVTALTDGFVPVLHATAWHPRKT